MDNSMNTTDRNGLTEESSPIPYDGPFEWGGITWYWWIYCQAVLSVMGLIGNSVIIFIYSVKIVDFSSMNRLIRGLAVADLCTSAFLFPKPAIVRTPNSLLGELYCKVIYNSNLMWISIVSSVYTLAMMSIEQCLAVVYPLQNRLMYSESRSKIILSVAWLASFWTNAFAYFATFRSHESGVCTFYRYLGGPFMHTIIGIFIFNLEYFIPTFIMVATHVKTLRCLRTQAERLMRHTGPRQDKKVKQDGNMLRAHQRVLKMLLVVVITFIFCWTADQIGFFLFNIGILEQSFLYSNVYQTFVVLASLNSCINPLIYTATNPQFRKSLKTFWNHQKTSSLDAMI